MDEPEELQESSSVQEFGDDQGVEEDFAKPTEPLSASRLSPYAIAAFATALLGLFLSPQSSLPFGPFEDFSWLVVPLLPSLVSGLVALLLADRAQKEILLSDAQLGGVGFFRAARIVAIATIAIVVLGTASRMVTYGWNGESDSEGSYVEIPEPGPIEFKDGDGSVDVEGQLFEP